MTDRVPLSVLVLTRDEELNLGRCLRSVVGWAEQVLVLDSFSADRTVEVARTGGAEVYQRRFDGFAAQRNWALDHLPFRHEWLLVLDADERVPPELRDEISAVLLGKSPEVAGFELRYRLIFHGKPIRHCGWHATWLLRLFRRTSGRWEDRAVDEHLLLAGARGRLRHELVHESLRDLEHWIGKHNRYSTHNALEYARIRTGAGTPADRIRPRLLGRGAERKRFIKERIWAYLPFRGFFFFVYLYVFRLGFLDGLHGYYFCRMHGIFQEFVSVKLWERLAFKGNAPEGWIEAAEDPAGDALRRPVGRTHAAAVAPEHRGPGVAAGAAGE